jgi:AAA domain
LFIDSGRVLPIIMADQVRFATRIATPLVEQMIVALLTNQIDVLIVDPFVSSHRVSENDNSAIEMVAKTWAEIAARANCSILLVHHTITQGRAMVMPPMSILAAAPRHWRRPQGRSGWSTS